MAYFEEFDKVVNSLRVTVNTSEEFEALKVEILKRVEEDILKLKADLSVEIKKGINDLVGLKAELGLQKNFKENIDSELSSATFSRRVFLFLFILSVVVIPIFLGSTFLVKNIIELPYRELIFLRASVTVSAAVLSYFFYTQYKLYQLISLRYSHLNGFLGGGATFINQIIGTEDNSRTDVNRRMADLFMEQKDVFGLVKANQHPIELSLDKVSEIVEKIRELGGKISRTDS